MPPTRTTRRSGSALVRALDRPGFIRPPSSNAWPDGPQPWPGMPEALQQRFLSRLETAEKAHLAASGHRRRGRRGGLLAAVLVFRSSAASPRGRSSQAAVSITDLIELGELDRAGEFIQTLEKADSGLLAYPAMIDAASDSRSPGIRRRTGDPVRPGDARGRDSPAPESDPKSLETAGRWRRARPRSRRSRISSSNGGPPFGPNERNMRPASGRGSLRSARRFTRSAGVSSPPVNEAQIQESISTAVLLRGHGTAACPGR